MLIGTENFSNPEGAIIELVKNTYDADSPCCYILFDGNDGQITEIYITLIPQHYNLTLFISS